MAKEGDVKTTVAISGAFDPLTVGHIRHIKEAAKYGNVVIILNTDSWVKRRGAEAVTPWNERAEILRAINGVHDVVIARDEDDTVCPTLKNLFPHYFAKGGHRTPENTPEMAMCIELGIALVWNCGK